MKEMTAIEKALLDREMNEIQTKLKKIGEDLCSVFDKYGAMSGKHGEEMQKFIIERVIKSNEVYFAGYITKAGLSFHESWVPECLKKVICEWASKDLLNKINELEEITAYIHTD